MNTVTLINWANKLHKTRCYNIYKTARYLLCYLFSKKVLKNNVEDAYSLLNSYYPKPDSTCLGNNVISEPKYDLQIIVPTYNNEKYLEECINSIISQKTTYKWKLIIINDGSTDNSKQILNKYTDIPNIEIIHSENGGLSSARNIGLSNIEAAYITFVDSDDTMPPNTIQHLLDCAIKNDADIVEGSYYRLYDDRQVKFNHLKNEQLNSSSKLIGMAWGKVYKSSLFKNIIFPKNMWFEDTICAFFLYHSAKRIFTISDYVYSYRIVTSSISHSSSKKMKSIDTIWVTDLVLKEYSKLNLPKDRSYHNTVMKQIILNEKRLCKLPIDVQESAFIIIADLFEKYCSAYASDKRYHDLNKFLLERDFGHYKLYCRTH
ncbi:glycosyltransferase [Butyrivibrio sp. AD3002]|uniref:glycosyltransferase n=1 Tax=Butyrivibrio sp. AD3002 TaxID=1280670 RepID=UPI0003B73FE7|nr:glycosyltransferase [Butyrivibrio sp. AD3002]